MLNMQYQRSIVVSLLGISKQPVALIALSGDDLEWINSFLFSLPYPLCVKSNLALREHEKDVDG